MCTSVLRSMRLLSFSAITFTDSPAQSTDFLQNCQQYYVVMCKS